MATVTLVYSAIATRVSASALATALGALPRDTSLEALAGLTLSSDTTGTSGNVASRTIVYTTAAPPAPLIPDTNIGETLTGWYTIEFSAALATPVVAALPVVT